MDLSGTTRSEGQRSPTRWLVPAFLLFLAVARCAFLLAGLDPAEERIMATLDPAASVLPAEPQRPLYDREELYAGTAAEAIRLGTGIPLSAYQYMPYAGGSLLVSLAAVPCYSLFGSTYLAFKIIPLLVTLGGGLLWLLVMRAWFGDRMAALFGLLYLLAPPVFVRTALIAKGDHPEAMAIIGLSFLLATQAARRMGRPSAPIWGFMSGAAVGLGVYVTYSTVPVTAGVTAAALVLTRARPRRLWLSGGVGLIVGLIPWLAMVAHTHGEALRVYGKPLGSALPATVVLERLGRLLTGGFAAGYNIPGGPTGRLVGGLAWSVAVLFGWGMLARSVRRSKVLPLVVAGTILHIAAFCFTAPDASSRYLIPGYPLLLLAAAYPAASSETARWEKLRWRSIPYLLAIAFGFLSQAAVIVESSYPALHSSMKGTDWQVFGEVLGQKLTPDGIDLFPADRRGDLYRGQGEWACVAVRPSDWPTIATRSGPDSTRFWEGIGVAWLGIWGPGTIGPYLQAMPAQRREAVLAGMALHLDSILAPMVVRAPGSVPSLMSELGVSAHSVIIPPFARSLGVLSSRGAIAREEPVRIGGGLVDPAEMLRGLGWAMYRGPRRGGGIRVWKPQYRLQGSLASPDNTAPVELFEGMASAFAWDLSRRSDDALIQRRRGVAPLIAELGRLTAGLDSLRASCFYREAGRVLAAVPSGSGDRRSEMLRDQLDLVPARFRAAFVSGLEGR